jgi:hypothetical protein
MASTQHLSPEHRQWLKSCAISDEVIDVRTYWSATDKADLGKLGFSPVQRNVPALVVPIWDQTGNVRLHQIRADEARFSKHGPIEFEVPWRSKLAADLHPHVRTAVLTPEAPLFIAWSVISGDILASRDLACISLLGVYGWKHQEHVWQSIPLRERAVHILVDSAIDGSPVSTRAVSGLVQLLKAKCARVSFLTVPTSASGDRSLASYFGSGGLVEDLLTLASDTAPFETALPRSRIYDYAADDDGIVRIMQFEDGPVRRPITNFVAKIVSETDFGSFRLLAIEVSIRGRTQLITVSADEFDRMSWPIPLIGADAIIYPGNGAKDEVRAAIQLLSTDITRFTGITRLGWHQISGDHVYVHATGVVGPTKTVEDDSATPNCPNNNNLASTDLAAPGDRGPILADIETRYGIRTHISQSLQRYELPHPSQGEALVHDIRRSLQFLKLAPPEISVPIYGAIWYAACTAPDFSIHLYGTSDQFKTEYAALAAQHFGPGLDARHLPANWGSTANFIRAISALAGNVVLPVDDFVPTGSRNEIERSFRAAEDVFRAQGNASGKGRCDRTGAPQNPDPPRCLILSTGEVGTSGYSLTSRVLTLEVHAGDIMDRSDLERLRRFTEAQAVAKSGAYARAMAAFLQARANNYEAELESLTEQALQFRELFSSECQHSRTADIAGKVLAGLDQFLDFAVSAAAIDEHELKSLWRLAHDGLYSMLASQKLVQADQCPEQRFIDLLKTVISTGRGHLQFLWEYSEDSEFGPPTFYGYQERIETKPVPNDPQDGESTSRTEAKSVYTHMGARLGWKKGDDLYLEPKQSLGAVQRLAREMGQPEIPLDHKALGKRLREHGLLKSSRKDRNVARRNIEGRQVEVFHFSVLTLIDLNILERDSVDEQYAETIRQQEDARRQIKHYRMLCEMERDRYHEEMQRQFINLLRDDGQPVRHDGQQNNV